MEDSEEEFEFGEENEPHVANRTLDTGPSPLAKPRAGGQQPQESNSNNKLEGQDECAMPKRAKTSTDFSSDKEEQSDSSSKEKKKKKLDVKDNCAVPKRAKISTDFSSDEEDADKLSGPTANQDSSQAKQQATEDTEMKDLESSSDSDEEEMELEPQVKPRGQTKDSLYLLMPEAGSLGQISNSSDYSVKKLPVWAFLVVVDAKDRRTWHLPVREESGKVNKRMLMDVRRELETGKIWDKKGLGFGLADEVMDRLWKLVELTWPGLPRFNLADCYKRHPNKVGNQCWIGDSKDLQSETQNLLASLASNEGGMKNEEMASDDELEDEETLRKQEEEARQEMERRQKEREEYQRAKSAQACEILSLLQSKRNASEDVTAVSGLRNNPKTLLNSPKSLELKLRQTIAKRSGDQKTLKILQKRHKEEKRKAAKAGPKVVDIRSKNRKDLLLNARQRHADETALRSGYRNAQEFVRKQLAKRDRMKRKQEKRDLKLKEFIQSQATSSQEDLRDGDAEDDDEEYGDDEHEEEEEEEEELVAEVKEEKQKQEQKSDSLEKPKKPVKTYLSTLPSHQKQPSEKVGIEKEQPVSKDTFEAPNAEEEAKEEAEEEESQDMVDEQHETQEVPQNMEVSQDLQEKIDKQDESSQEEPKEQPNKPEEEENEKDKDKEDSKAKDRSAHYKKLLLAENQLLKAKRRNKGEWLEEEASEEESDDGIGDYGENGDKSKKRKRSNSEEMERRLDMAMNRLSAEDFEGIVDDASDDEGKDGGDVGELHREQQRLRDEAELEQLQEDIRNHRLLASRKRKSKDRFNLAFGDDSDDEETDEEDEMAREERYRIVDMERREEAAKNVGNDEDKGETLDEIDREAEEQALFLKLARLEKLKMKLARKGKTKQQQLEAQKKKKVVVSKENMEDFTKIINTLKRSTSVVSQKAVSTGTIPKPQQTAEGISRSASMHSAPPSLGRSISGGGSKRTLATASFIRTISEHRREELKQTLTKEKRSETVSQSYAFVNQEQQQPQQLHQKGAKPNYRLTKRPNPWGKKGKARVNNSVLSRILG